MERFVRLTVLPFILVALVAIVWRQTLNQTLQGEGYNYFDYRYNYFSGNILSNIGYKNLNRQDNFGEILASATIPVFRDNFLLYQISQLTIFGLLIITIYYVVFNLTKNEFLAFTASLLSLSNFNGNYEMLAEGEYSRFMGRVPSVIPIIIAWYLLYKYYKTDSLNRLIASFVFVAIAVFMCHYAVLLLPLIIFSAIYFPHLAKKRFSVIKTFFIITIFLGISYLLIFQDHEATKNGLITFIINEPFLLEKVIYQMVTVTWPYLVILKLGKHFELAMPFLPILRILAIPTMVFYLVGGWLVFKKSKKLFPLYIGLFITIIADIFLYLFIDGWRINPLRTLWPGRQFFVTSIYVSIITALILQSFFNTKNIPIKIFLLSFLATMFIYNTMLITKYNESNRYLFERDKRFIAYMHSISGMFNDNSVLITGRYLRSASMLVARLYAPPKMQFPVSYEQFQSLNPERKNVIAIDYVHGKDNDGRFTSQGGYILDLTQEYKSGIVDYKDVMGAYER